MKKILATCGALSLFLSSGMASAATIWATYQTTQALPSLMTIFNSNNQPASCLQDTWGTTTNTCSSSIGVDIPLSIGSQQTSPQIDQSASVTYYGGNFGHVGSSSGTLQCQIGYSEGYQCSNGICWWSAWGSALSSKAEQGAMVTADFGNAYGSTVYLVCQIGSGATLDKFTINSDY